MSSGEEKEPQVRVLDLTPEHYELLKSLEQRREAVTKENPLRLQKYFRGLRLRYIQADRAIARDMALWRIQVTHGFFRVTRLKQRTPGKERVRVEQS